MTGEAAREDRERAGSQSNTYTHTQREREEGGERERVLARLYPFNLSKNFIGHDFRANL